MTVIWGLDLKEMQWGKFKSSYMFGNTDYHLRRTKFVVYQLAMIFCVISESLGTAALSDYIDQQKYLVRQNKQAIEYNDDYVGIGSYNIWCGIFVAFIFGAAFFFDLFWPERHESRSVRLAWRICAVLSCIFVLASAIAMTVILTTHTAYIKNVDQATADQLLSGFPKSGSPLDYRKNGRAIASLVFLWPGWVFTVISTVVLFMSYKHDDELGPFSTHARNIKEIKRDSYTTNDDPESNMMHVGDRAENPQYPATTHLSAGQENEATEAARMAAAEKESSVV